MVVMLVVLQHSQVVYIHHFIFHLWACLCQPISFFISLLLWALCFLLLHFFYERWAAARSPSILPPTAFTLSSRWNCGNCLQISSAFSHVAYVSKHFSYCMRISSPCGPCYVLNTSLGATCQCIPMSTVVGLVIILLHVLSTSLFNLDTWNTLCIFASSGSANL